MLVSRAGWNFWDWQGHRVHYIKAGTQVSYTPQTFPPPHTHTPVTYLLGTQPG